MAVPNRRKMTVEKKHKIVDNLNSDKPIHKKLAEDVENHNYYNNAKFQVKIRNIDIISNCFLVYSRANRSVPKNIDQFIC